MRSSIIFLLTVLCCALLSASNTNSQAAASSILATVNGRAVTLNEVLRESSASEALARAYAAQGEVSAEIAKLRQDAVDRIIDRKLLVDEFKRLKLVMPQKYVESMLDDLAVNLNCRTRSELAAKARAASKNYATKPLNAYRLKWLQAENSMP